MNKTKTKLENMENKFELFFGLTLIFLLISFFVILIEYSNVNYLESQLVECQENYPKTEWKNLAITGEEFIFYIDGMEFINHNGSFSFWVEVVNDNLPHKELAIWNRTIPNVGEKKK